jgi:HK97 family phage prohead protease
MDDADFSGYATKAGLKCSDGRTITAEAFKHMDGMKVPLVWQHGHDKPDNVLGHGVLEARADGMYVHGFFNSTPQGKTAKNLVQHEDIKSLSIYANQLKETVVRGSKNVIHGVIREVSLVLSGANPGAVIDQVRLAHADGEIEELDDEAIIFTGLELQHGDGSSDSTDETDDSKTETDDSKSETEETADDAVSHAAIDEKTAQEIYDSFSEEEKAVVHYMLGAALTQAASDNSAAHSGENGDSTDGSTKTDTEGNLIIHQEGNNDVSRNVFDQSGTKPDAGPKLSHTDIESIFAEAKRTGSWKEGLQNFLNHSDNAELKHSIENIELLFPEAQAVNPDDPQFITRRMEWVTKVLAGTKKSPFAKVKTILADITADEARAKGYVKGNLKTEEVLTLLRRTTGPATIYKKQKLDRDDILDITDINVVMWLKAEMRVMIEEELARAILVGDGRSALSPDKVKDPAGSTDGTGIRSVLNDHDLYAVKADLAANVSPKDAVKGLVRARSKYRGSGKPTLFISDAFLTDIMLEEDKFGRPLYETEASLRDKLRVQDIVTIDLFDEYPDLFAIMVSLADYTIGSNRGGELTSFEDFDIDYNQYKYLQETRLSGGLTKPYSAVVVRRSEGTLAAAEAPSFDGATNTITIPTTTGVVYTVNDEVVTGDVVITAPTTVSAEPADGYYLAYNTTRDWTYTP